MSEAATRAPATRAPEGSTVTEASAPTEVSPDWILSQQGLEDVSEADLMGIDPESTENKTAPSESTDEGKEPTDEEKKAEEEETDKTKEESKDETKDETKEEPVKPPKGFVPIAAIHEVRGENRYLKEQIAELTARLSAAPPPEAPKTGFEDFKELTEVEFKEMAEENPADALIYVNKLNAYKDFQRNQQESTEYMGSVFARATELMEEAIPGIFTDDEVSAEFRSFAEETGFTEDMFYLTNPATKIILPGETEPLLLGEQAAQVMRVLANARAKINALPNVEELKKSIRKELETEILAKVKSGQQYKSLSDVPTSEEAMPSNPGKMLSEAEYMKLSPKEQEAYLAGQ